MDSKYVIASRYSDGKLGYVTNFDPILWGWELNDGKIYDDWEEITNVFEKNCPAFQAILDSTDIVSIFIKTVS